MDSDGSRDVDPSRIYSFGFSFGALIATQFLAVAPNVRAGVLNSAGGPDSDVRRLGPAGGRANFGSAPFGSFLAARIASLFNSPGVTSIGDVSVGLPHFNENLPPCDGVPFAVDLEDGTTNNIQSPVRNAAPGAMAIQQFLDNLAWVTMSGESAAHAPHPRKAPLAGVPAKPVIVLFGKGDVSVPNPAETALLRAGGLADRATFYRNDLAYAEDSLVPNNPHGFKLGIDSPSMHAAAVARGAEEQSATFFASDGTKIIHPEPARYFEMPIKELPEDLNYIP